MAIVGEGWLMWLIRQIIKDQKKCHQITRRKKQLKACIFLFWKILILRDGVMSSREREDETRRGGKE
jgi:hypothetical protein